MAPHMEGAFYKDHNVLEQSDVRRDQLRNQPGEVAKRCNQYEKLKHIFAVHIRKESDVISAPTHGSVWERIFNDLKLPFSGRKTCKVKVKYFQLMWRQNRGGLREYVMETWKSSGGDQPSTTEDRRVKKPKRFSRSWETGLMCVCQKQYRGKAIRACLECEKCEEWYHFDCIGLEKYIDRCPEKYIFFCGKNRCNDGKMVMSLENDIDVNSEQGDVVMAMDTCTNNSPTGGMKDTRTATCVKFGNETKPDSVIKEIASGGNSCLKVGNEKGMGHCKSNEEDLGICDPRFNEEDLRIGNLKSNEEDFGVGIAESIAEDFCGGIANSKEEDLGIGDSKFNEEHLGTGDLKSNEEDVGIGVPKSNGIGDPKSNEEDFSIGDAESIAEDFCIGNANSKEEDFCINDDVPSEEDFGIGDSNEEDFSMGDAESIAEDFCIGIANSKEEDFYIDDAKSSEEDFRIGDATTKEEEYIIGTECESVNENCSINHENEGIETNFDRPYKISNSSTDNESLTDGENENRQKNGDIGAYLNSLPISKETIAACTGVEIDNLMLEKPIPDKASFRITEAEWTALCQDLKGRYFAIGKWHRPFIDGLKKSNPYCVFMVKRHRVSIAKARKRSTSRKVLDAAFYCKFGDCNVIAHLEMDGHLQVNVAYSGNVLHCIKEQNARPIRGPERDELKDIFAHGEKPLNEYLRRIGAKDKATYSVMGNCDGVGKTTQVFRQIAHESNKCFVMDTEELTSVLKMAESMRVDERVKKVSGFIQLVASSPVFIFYWTEEGVRLWHDLCNKDVAVIDATGRVVRCTPSKKKYLFYEISVRNPVEGESPIPIMAMLSNSHTATVIRFWLSEFRRAEKSIFGHQHLSMPYQINMDRAMAFIVAILEEINHETLKEFLDRCFRIATGHALDYDLVAKTVPHACASHVMKDVKKLCKKVYPRNIDYGLWSFSTILNASNMKEAEDALFDMAVVLQGKMLSSAVKAASERMLERINLLSSDKAFKQDIYDVGNSDDPVQADDSMPSNIITTEEEFLTLAEGTKFAKWAENIIVRAKSDVQQGNGKELLETNGRYAPKLLGDLQRLFLPTLPLWSGIMLGDLGRHGSTAPYTRYTFPSYTSTTGRGIGNTSKTTSVQEGRFNQLKNVILQGKTRNRLDVFTAKLHESTKALQMNALKTCIKGKVKRVKGKQTVLIKEEWNKKSREPEKLRNTKQGKYQQPPTKTIPVIKATKSKQKDQGSKKEPLQKRAIKRKICDVDLGWNEVKRKKHCDSEESGTDEALSHYNAPIRKVGKGNKQNSSAANVTGRSNIDKQDRGNMESTRMKDEHGQWFTERTPTISTPVNYSDKNKNRDNPLLKIQTPLVMRRTGKQGNKSEPIRESLPDMTNDTARMDNPLLKIQTPLVMKKTGRQRVDDEPVGESLPDIDSRKFIFSDMCSSKEKDNFDHHNLKNDKVRKNKPVLKIRTQLKMKKKCELPASPDQNNETLPDLNIDQVRKDKPLLEIQTPLIMKKTCEQPASPDPNNQTLPDLGCWKHIKSNSNDSNRVEKPVVTNKTSVQRQGSSDIPISGIANIPMHNGKNNCWFNACIQALVATSAVDHLLPAPSEIFDYKEKKMRKFLFKFERNTQITQEDIDNVVNRLLDDQGTLVYGRQNDAHEFLTQYIGTMMQKIQLNDIFVKQVVVCINCGETAEQDDHMTEFVIPLTNITGDGSIVRLQESINNQLEPEYLENTEPCKCQEKDDELHGNKYRQTLVKEAPRILVLLLQRNQGPGLEKLMTDIDVKDELTIHCYESAKAESTEAHYTLRSVIVHKGERCSAGHYITYVKLDSRNQWALCDDRIIKIASDFDIQDLYDQSYVLFYERVNRPRAQEPEDGLHSGNASDANRNATQSSGVTKIPHEEQRRSSKQDVVKSIMRNLSKNSNKIMTQIQKIAIRYCDIATLYGNNWLNDNIINGYLEIITISTRLNKNVKKCYAFKAQWYEKVKKDGCIEGIRKWTKNINLTDYDIIFFPVNKDAHWILICIDMKDKKAIVYDSLLGINRKVMQSAVEVVVDHLQEKFSTEFSCESKEAKVPMQSNLDDCGVYVCYFARYIASHGDIYVIPDINTKLFRQHMIYEFYKGNLVI